MDKETQKHLNTLLDSDIDVYIKKKSAEFFLKLFQNGTFVDEAITPLMNLFTNSQQVPVMEPAIDALVVYFLKKQQYQPLIDFIEKQEYISFALDGINRTVKRGENIGDLIPYIIKFFSKENFGAVHIIENYLKLQKGDYSEKCQKVAELILNDPNAYKSLPFVVQEMAIDHFDTAPLLPVLIKLLPQKKKSLESAIISSLWWALEYGGDLSEVIDFLEEYMHKPSKEQVRAAYSLGLHYCKKKQWQKLAQLIKSPTLNIRKGIFQALGSNLNHNSNEVLNLLFDGFFDTENEIRLNVLNILIERERTKKKIIPNQELLKRFKTFLLQNGLNAEIDKYFCLVSGQNVDAAAQIQNILSDPAFRSNSSIQELLGRIQGYQKQQYSTVCSICKHIPRANHGSYEGDLPREASKFNLPSPSIGGDSMVFKCPECGVYYQYSYSQEYDDMSLDTSLELNRFDLIETINYLKGDELDKFKATIPQYLEEYDKDLFHPNEFKKREAAWNLLRYYRTNNKWDEVKKISEIKDIAIQSEIFTEFINSGENSFPFEAFKDYFYQGLLSAEKQIQRDATLLIAANLIRKGDYEEIRRLLAIENQIIQLYLLYQIWMAVRRDHFDIDPILALLINFTKAKDKGIRQNASYAIQEAHVEAKEKKKTKKSKTSKVILTQEKKVEIIASNLDESDPEMQKDALFNLEHIIKEGANITDFTKFLPKIVDLIEKKETEYYALGMLEVFVGKNGDMTHFIPNLIRIFGKGTMDRKSDLAQLFYMIMKTGVDISGAFETLGKVMIQNKGDLRAIATRIFEYALKLNQDISVIEPFLWNTLGKGSFDSYAEFFIKALTAINLKHHNWEKVKILLEHENVNVPGPSASWLAECKDDIEPLVPTLLKNLLHDYWYARDRAAGALLHYTQRNPKQIERIKQDIAKIQVPKGLKKEKLKEYYELIDQLETNSQQIIVEQTVSKLEQTLQEVQNKISYLTNIERVCTYKGKEEARYTFFLKDRILDLWFDSKKQKITECSWIPFSEFTEVIEKGYTDQGVKQYIKPYKEIPKNILEIAFKVLDVCDQIFTDLNESSNWFLLDTYSEYKRYLYTIPNSEFYDITFSSDKKIKYLHPIEKNRVVKELSESILKNFDRHCEKIDTTIIDQAIKIRQIVDDTMKRIEQGEVCINIEDDYYHRYYIYVNKRYFFIFADGGNFDTVSERRRDAVIEELFELITRTQQPPAFKVLPKDLFDKIFERTQIDQYPEMIKQGKISIGGGFTSDMQWSITYQNGKFLREQADGYGNISAQELSQTDIETIVKEKRFGWVHNSFKENNK